MTVQTVITATGAGTWVPPPDCPPGTQVLIEGWGAGSGAGGTTTNGSAGGAGNYASTTHTITAADLSGITYTVGAGTAGTGASNPSAGGDTTVASVPKNLVPNAEFVGAVVGGALPTGWVTVPNGLTITVAALGFDVTTGLNYIDLTYSGTLSGTSFLTIIGANNSGSSCCAGFSPALSYTCSGYIALISGALTNVTSIQYQLTSYQVNGSTFISTLNAFTLSGTPPSVSGTLTRHTGTVTTPALTAMCNLSLTLAAPTSSAISFTMRIAGFQVEQAASVTAYQATPTAYILAKGGGAPVTTTGGASPDSGNCFGTRVFKGGNGAAFNANGSGGGGAAGSAGAGAVGTTAGVGGTADNGSGGTGGARKTTSPGNAGTANVEGGGGGGAVITATSATGGAGGAPGGGAGAAETTSSTGGTGARGQVRFGYTPFPLYQPWLQRAPVLAQ